MDNQEYFENAPVLKAIAKFAVPTVLSQLITLLYNLADAFFVGHTNDPNQLAALTLCFPLYMFLTGIGNLFGIGANSMISRSLGLKRPEQAKKASAFAFYGAICVTILFAIIQLVCMRPILNVVGASDATYDFTASYLTWTIVIGGLPTIITLMLAHLVRAEGRTKEASIGMSMGAILNIILDPIMVLVLGFGVTGAAIATAFSNTVAMVYFLILVYRNRENSVVKLSPHYLGWYPALMGEILLVGFPSALVILFGSSANIVTTHYMSLYGDLSVAAYGIVQKIGNIGIQVTLGITQGIMPLIGYNYAAGNKKRTADINKFSAIILGIYAAILLIAVELFPGAFVHAFINEAQTEAIAVPFTRNWMVCIPFLCIAFMINCIFQAMGLWQQATFIAILRQGISLIPLLIILNHFMGAMGLIWAEPVSDFIGCAFGVYLYYRHSKKMS